jgi:pimeloyl-ACP methyl ester carboxylesterase
VFLFYLPATAAVNTAYLFDLLINNVVFRSVVQETTQASWVFTVVSLTISSAAILFSKLNCNPRWRERLSELAIPTLVVHGRRDRFFPVGNGEALAREIPDARLLVLERAATAIPDAAAGEVTAAMLAL